MKKKSATKTNLTLLAKLLRSARTPRDLKDLLKDLLTPAEIKDLVERWKLVQALHHGKTQRYVRDLLGISISKVSRGAYVLQNGSGGFRRLLTRKKNKKR